jgi:3-hydroxyacyl-CoA dehydrogenase
MAATGNPVSATEAFEIGLVDRLIEGDLEQHAVAFADEVKAIRPIPKTSERDDKLAEARTNPAIFDAFRTANARKFRGFDAPEYVIRAIEAAVAKPYAEGVQDERRLFMELMSGTRGPSNISSSPSARPRRSKACRTTPGRARSARSGSSAPVPWVAAFR